LARQDKRSGTGTENWTANPTRVHVCTQCESDAHIALARRAVRESIVLLKNKNGVLPLSTADFQGKKNSLAVTFL
jgi:beta-glucosidase-like glycosyl hydrolase